MTGHFAKSNVPPVRGIAKCSLSPIPATRTSRAPRPAIVLSTSSTNDKFVDVIGNSKGRGFAGVIRRHGFGGGPKSHGHMFQVQGSIGASSFPSRVFPGQRMPGHMGDGRSRSATSASAASMSMTTFCWSKAQSRARVTVTSWSRRPRRRRGNVVDLPAPPPRTR